MTRRYETTLEIGNSLFRRNAKDVIVFAIETHSVEDIGSEMNACGESGGAESSKDDTGRD